MPTGQFVHIRSLVTDIPPVIAEVFSLPFWKDKRRYSRFEALIDVCANLTEFSTNIPELCARWQWSRVTVFRFLNMIRDDGFIEREIVFARAGLQRHVPARWVQTRLRIFQRDGYVCQYCGTVGIALECDHIVPISKGGSNDDENLLTACRTCNRSKNDKLLSDWKGAK